MYRINKRPKDDSDEDEKFYKNRQPKNHTTDDIKHEETDTKLVQSVSNNVMNIFIWFEWPEEEAYDVGSHGQQSYSYAYPNDIIIGYNYLNMDSDWFLWLLNMNKLSPIQFLWKHSKLLYPKDILNDEFLLRQISLIIQERIEKNNNLKINIKPYSGLYYFPEIHPAIDKIKQYVGKKYSKNIIKCIPELEWTRKYSNKTCLHRNINNLKTHSVFEKHNLFSDELGLTENKGYICYNKNEIIKAYDLLINDIGHLNVVIKDCEGDGGND
eukprot:313633_1